MSLLTTPDPRPQTLRGGRLLFRQRALDQNRRLFLSRLFNEDSGDLGSLPAPRPSESKPVTPVWVRVVALTQGYNAYPTSVIRRSGEPRLVDAPVADRPIHLPIGLTTFQSLTLVVLRLALG